MSDLVTPLGSMEVPAEVGSVSVVGLEGSVSSEVKVPELPYECYLCIPKVVSSTLLTTLDKLGKMAASLQARNVVIRSTKENVLFVYDNTFFKFEFSLPNLTGHVLSDLCLSIDHLKKFFGIASSYLSIVELVNDTKLYGAGKYVVVGRNLVSIDVQQFEVADYTFEWPEFTDTLDGSALASRLGSFTSLLSLAERAPEKQLITSEGQSYINIGSIFGRTKSFFGDSISCVVNRVLVDCISLLSAFDGSDVRALFDNKRAFISFGTTAKLMFAYTTGAAVGRLLSPVFRDSFKYDSVVHIDQSEFSSLLSLVSSLDYFADMVTMQFSDTQLTFTVHQKDEDKDMTYSFDYLDGTTQSGTLVVPLQVLLGVLSLATRDAGYSCTGNNLIVDTGDFVYCVRSTMTM